MLWLHHRTYGRSILAISVLLGGLLAGPSGTHAAEKDPKQSTANGPAAVEPTPDAGDQAAEELRKGQAAAEKGQLEAAITHYRKAIELNPRCAEPYNAFGVELSKRCGGDEAIALFRKAIELKPNFAEAHLNLAGLLAAHGRIEEAIVHYQKILEIDPKSAKAHNGLGIVLARQGELDDAIAHLVAALELKPKDRRLRKDLDAVVSDREAVLKQFLQQRDALRAHPKDVTLLNDVAWMLATAPNATIRNGAEAVEIADRAVKLTNGKQPEVLGTLAAAYAETGQFDKAVETARKAVKLAEKQSNKSLVESLKVQLRFYESGKPFRESRPVAPVKP